jgi:DNA-binding transcriptional ArsR family regulator
MDSTNAINALSALAQPSRLAVFKMLVKVGNGEIAAGDIARELGVPPSTLSVHLGILARAGLVTARRESRTIFYRADIAGMTSLMAFLIEDCCDGRTELCTPLSGIVQRAVACCDGDKPKN